MYAGIDLGTSGCRLVVIDQDKATQHESRISYAAKQSQTPDLWLQSAFQLLAGIPDSLRKQLQALAIDGTSGTVLLCDQAGNPSSPALMYNDTCDHETAQGIKQIAPANSAAHGASSSLGKFIDLVKTYPNQPHAHVLHQADWVASNLTCYFGLSDENNALKMGYDPIKRCWADWLKSIDVDLSLLPKVQAPASLFANIDRHIAKRLDLPESMHIVAGTTDSIAAFLATGARHIGEAVTSLGSTLSLKIIADKPIFAPELGVYSHRLWDQWLVGGASNSGGAVLLQHFTAEQMQSMTHDLKPYQTTGLDYYPLPKIGERFPIADPQLAPRLEPRPASDTVFFQGMLEGIADIEHKAYQTLHQLGAPYPTKLYTAGGGGSNTAWTDIRSQKMGLKIQTSIQHEAAYGAALLALISKTKCLS